MPSPSDQILHSLLAAGCERLRQAIDEPVMPVALEFLLEGRSRRLVDLLAITSSGRLLFVEIKSGHEREGFMQLIEYPALARDCLDAECVLRQWRRSIRERAVPEHIARRALGREFEPRDFFAQAVDRLKAGDYEAILAVRSVTPSLARLAALQARNPLERPVILLGVGGPSLARGTLRPSRAPAGELSEPDARLLRADLVRAYAERGLRRAEIARALRVSTRTVERDFEILLERYRWRYRPERYRKRVCEGCGRPTLGKRCRSCHEAAQRDAVERRLAWLVEHPQATHREAGDAWGVSDETIRKDRRRLRRAGCLPDVEVVSYRLFDEAIADLWRQGRRLEEIARQLDLPDSAVGSRIEVLRRGQKISRRNAIERDRFRTELADLLADRSMLGAAEAARQRGWTARDLGKRIRDLRQILAA